MQVQEPERMATTKVYAYLNNPATKRHRFILVMHHHQVQAILASNWEKTCFTPKFSKFYVGKG